MWTLLAVACLLTAYGVQIGYGALNLAAEIAILACLFLAGVVGVIGVSTRSRGRA